MENIGLTKSVTIIDAPNGRKIVVIEGAGRIEVPLVDNDNALTDFEIVGLPKNAHPSELSPSTDFPMLPSAVVALRDDADLVLKYDEGMEIILKGFFAKNSSETIVVSLPAQDAPLLEISNNMVGKIISVHQELLVMRGQTPTLMALSNGDSTLRYAMVEILEASDMSTTSTFWGTADTSTTSTPWDVSVEGSPFGGSGVSPSTAIALGAVVAVAAASGSSSSASPAVDPIESTVKTVISSTAGTDKTYGLGEKIEIILTFPEVVNVTGTPQIDLGFNSRKASYVSGNNSNELVFEYTVASGDVDADGITISTNALSLNGGMIKDAKGKDVGLGLVAVTTASSHKVDGIEPTLATGGDAPSVAVDANGGDSVGDKVVLTLTFTESVTGLTGGTDDTIFKVAGTGVSATWGGSGTTRTLTYTVAADHNGQLTIDEANLKDALTHAANGIKDIAGNVFTHTGAISNIDTTALPDVDGTAPTLSATPTSVVSKAGADIAAGDTVVLTLTFKESVAGLTGRSAPTIFNKESVTGLTGETDDTIFKVDGIGASAVWGGSGLTRTLTYTVVSGQEGRVTIDEAALRTKLLAAGITDAKGNAFDYTGNIPNIDTTALPLIEINPPTLSTIMPPATTLTGGGDSIGDTVVLELTFTESVTGLTGGTDDTIFKLGGTGVSATWSGSGAIRTLTYTVSAGQSGQVTIDEGALKTKLLAAGIKDAAGKDLVITGDIDNIDSTALPTVDGTAPTFSATPTHVVTKKGERLVIGETVVLTMRFTEDVTGLTGGTDDTIFRLLGTGVSATWGGTGDTRTLTYTPTAGKSDLNNRLSIDEVALKAALVAGITDAKGNAFVYTANSGNIPRLDSGLPFVDNLGPTLHGQTPFDYQVEGSGVGGRIGLLINLPYDTSMIFGLKSGTVSGIFTIGGKAVSAVWGEGDRSRTLIYTIKAGDNGVVDIDEVKLKEVLVGGIKSGIPGLTDYVGNPFSHTNGAGEDIPLPKVDTSRFPIVDTGTAVPTLSTTTPPVTTLTGSGKTIGDTVVLELTFSEAVMGLTSGTDSTIFKVGGTGVSATWGGGVGETRTLTYTVSAGQNGQLTIDEGALKTKLVAEIKDGTNKAFTHTGDIADIDSSSNPLPVVRTPEGITGFTEGSTSNNWVAYDKDDFYIVKVAFSEAVSVDLSEGSPTITVNLGDETRTLDYRNSLDGGKTLEFSYQVKATDPAGAIFHFGTQVEITPNGATIKDTDGANAYLIYSGSFKDPANSAGAADHVSGYREITGTTTENDDTLAGSEEFLDSFVWDAGKVGGTDTIVNFSDRDRIDLSAIVSGYTSGAKASDWIKNYFYESQHYGEITFDLDGAGSGTATQTIILHDNDFTDRITLDNAISNGNIVLG